MASKLPSPDGTRSSLGHPLTTPDSPPLPPTSPTSPSAAAPPGPDDPPHEAIAASLFQPNTPTSPNSGDERRKGTLLHRPVVPSRLGGSERSIDGAAGGAIHKTQSSSRMAGIAGMLTGATSPNSPKAKKGKHKTPRELLEDRKRQSQQEAKLRELELQESVLEALEGGMGEKGASAEGFYNEGNHQGKLNGNPASPTIPGTVAPPAWEEKTGMHARSGGGGGGDGSSRPPLDRGNTTGGGQMVGAELANELRMRARAKQSKKKKSAWQFIFPVFHPQSVVRAVWDFITVFLLFALSIYLPILLCFDLNVSGAMKFLVDFTDVFFICDVFLNFRTGFFPARGGPVVIKPMLIAKNYLQYVRSGFGGRESTKGG